MHQCSLILEGIIDAKKLQDLKEKDLIDATGQLLKTIFHV